MQTHLSAAQSMLMRRFGDGIDRGATAVEYSIVAAFIAAVIVIGVTAFGGATLGLFASTTDAFEAAGIGS
jgi:Flp pilus assembly pilin Flp